MSFKNRLTKAIYVFLGITNYKGNTLLKNLTLAMSYKHRKSKQTAQPYEYLLRKRDLNGIYSFSHPHWQFNGIELLDVGEDDEYYETLRKE